MSVRPRRTIPSAVNTPVSVSVSKVSSISNDEAQGILTSFLDSLSHSDSTQNGTSISQLQRCQRELRGLVPLTADSAVPVTAPTGSQAAAVPQNKKIKFDDVPEEVQQEQEQEQEPEQEQEAEHGEKKIDKEERKRLKKERRKEERKRKLEQAQDDE